GARTVAEPAGEDRRDQGEEVAGCADAPDQEVRRPARDHEGRDRDELERDRRPVRALPEPHRVDAQEAAKAHPRCRRHGRPWLRDRCCRVHVAQPPAQTTNETHAVWTGMAKASASAPSTTSFAVAMPTTWPCRSTTGPPLLPGLMAAVNCM